MLQQYLQVMLRLVSLTYQDVTNIDALGIGTFREGIFLPDNKKAEFAPTGSGDLQIFHDGNNSIIKDMALVRSES